MNPAWRLGGLGVPLIPISPSRFHRCRIARQATRNATKKKKKEQPEGYHLAPRFPLSFHGTSASSEKTAYGTRHAARGTWHSRHYILGAANGGIKQRQLELTEPEEAKSAYQYHLFLILREDRAIPTMVGDGAGWVEGGTYRKRKANEYLRNECELRDRVTFHSQYHQKPDCQNRD